MKYFTLVVSILITIAVLLPGSKIPNVGIGGVDKLVHIAMFASWAVAFRFDFAKIRPLTIMALGLMFSIFTEIIQLFVEGRSFDLYDMLADAVGLLLGLIVAKPVNALMHRILGTKA